MKKINITTALIALIALSASAAPLEYWTFEDAAGKKLNQATNSGSNGSPWDWGKTEGVTDGAGHFVLQFDFDNDTVDYYVDGVKTKSFTDFNADTFSRLMFQKLGEGWADAASSVVLNEFGVSQMPASTVRDEVKGNRVR